MSTFREYKKNRPADPALAAQYKTEMQHELDREQLIKETVNVYTETPWNPAGSHPTRKDAIKRVILFLETQGWTPPPTPAHNTTTEN